MTLNKIILGFISEEFDKLRKESDASYTILLKSDLKSKRYCLRIIGINKIRLIDRKKEIVKDFIINDANSLSNLDNFKKTFFEDRLKRIKGECGEHPYIKGLYDFIDKKNKNWLISDDIIYCKYTNIELYPYTLGIKKYPDKKSIYGSIMSGSFSAHRYSNQKKSFVIGEGFKECLIAQKIFSDFNILEAGGLYNIKNILEQLPEYSIVYILGENDSKFEYNKIKADFPFVKIAYPKIGKDFADQYLLEKDLNSLKESMTCTNVESGDVSYKPLGINGTNLYIYSKLTKSVHCFNPGEREHILRTCHSLTGWETLRKSEKDIYSNMIFKECVDEGEYSSENEFGVGLWNYKDKYYFNTGAQVYEVDESGVHLRRYEDVLKNDFLLVKKSTSQKFLPEDDKYDITPLENAIVKCDWKIPEHGKIFLGFLAQSYFAGSIDFRPTLWIMSDKTTAGKTWLTSWIIKYLAINSKIQESGKTSAAGFRQSVANFSLPVFIDEFGEKDSAYKNNTKEILELLRSAATGMSMIKIGQADQKEISQRIKFSTILSCIDGYELIGEQDYERMIFVKLISRNKENFFNNVKPLFDACQKDQAAFITYVLKRFFLFKEYLNKFLQITISDFRGHRFKGLASVLAGYSILKNSFNAGEELYSVLKNKDKELFSAFHTDDSTDVYESIMGLMIQAKTISGDYQEGGYIIIKEYLDRLSHIGIKCVFDGTQVVIRPNVLSQFLNLNKIRIRDKPFISGSALSRLLRLSSYFKGYSVYSFNGKRRKVLLFNTLKQEEK